MTRSVNLPLFTLAPEILAHFQPLCQQLPDEAIFSLQQQLVAYLEKVQSSLKQNEFLDIATAQEIGSILSELLVQHGSYSEAKQALIIGAAKYFIKDDDAEHDTFSLLGFDDDVMVLNAVLETLGLSERKIQL